MYRGKDYLLFLLTISMALMANTECVDEGEVLSVVVQQNLYTLIVKKGFEGKRNRISSQNLPLQKYVYKFTT